MKACAGAFIILGLIALFGPAQAGAPRVVASIKPVHSLVSAVMQGAGEPGLLVGGSGSPHAYALRPSEARALSRADIVFWVGPDFEMFLKKPLQALASGAVSIALMDQPEVTVLPARRGGLVPAADDNIEHKRADILPPDGHIWLDPANAIAIVRVIARRLQQADAARAELYADNAAATIAALDKLDADLRSQLEPVKRVPFVVYHDAFQYFEKRYGLNAVGFIATTPEQMIGAKRVAAIAAEIARSQPVCIFTEPVLEPELVRTLMNSTGLRLGSLDPEGAAMLPGSKFYSDLMRGLSGDFITCLSGAVSPSR